MSAVVRLLVLATHVPAGGALGGVVRYTTELLGGLAARDDVRVDALATAAARPFLERLLPGGRVHTVPGVGTPALSLWERYAPLPNPKADGAGYDGVLGVKHLVPRRSRAMRVLTVHDMVLLDRPEDFAGPKGRLLPGPYRASLREADLLLCVSRATRDRVLAHVPSAAGRAMVVPLATAPSLLDTEDAPVVALAGRRFALVVGDAGTRKNLGVVVDAWDAVRRQVPDAVLAVAGPPAWGRSEHGEAYERLRAAGSLVALGRVSDAELRWCYRHAAVTLCPSIAEGFGLPAAEALDLGGAVVVSDDAALVEVSAGRALASVPAHDRDGWARATVGALRRPTSTAVASPNPRTWQNVAEDTVRAIRDARFGAGL